MREIVYKGTYFKFQLKGSKSVRIPLAGNPALDEERLVKEWSKWTEDEYCLYVNCRELSPLWSLLADRTQSGDPEVWATKIAAFTELIERWARLKFVQLYAGSEWPPPHVSGQKVPDDDVAAVLSDPERWRCLDNPTRVITVALSERDIAELEEGM